MQKKGSLIKFRLNRSLMYISGLLFFVLLCFPLLHFADVPGDAPVPAHKQLDGKDLFQYCISKFPGEDQRSRFKVLLRDAKGNIKQSEYLRIWKDFKGQEGVADKMILFTTFPPEAKGSAFMRVTYVSAVKKNVDQWIYLPVLKKIRRVSIRNQSDSFLNSNLTYADVDSRALAYDVHEYKGVRNVKGKEFHVVESIPREDNPQYSKRVFWFAKGDAEDWSECVNVRIDYYALDKKLLKEQFIKWQRIENAWVWDRVLVRNVRTKTVSRFEVSGVKINTGLKSALFSERTLFQGMAALPKIQKK